jgi:hypothetical protein
MLRWLAVVTVMAKETVMERKAIEKADTKRKTKKQMRVNPPSQCGYLAPPQRSRRA